MTVFIELASQLLTSEIGSLVYYLVLVFSIAGALQTCLRFWNKDSSEMRRMVWGLKRSPVAASSPVSGSWICLAGDPGSG